MKSIDKLTLREQNITKLLKIDSTIGKYEPPTELKNSLIEQANKRHPRRPSDFRLRTYMFFTTKDDKTLRFNFLDAEGLNSTYWFWQNDVSDISTDTTQKVINVFEIQIERTMGYRQKIKSGKGAEPAFSDAEYTALLKTLPSATLKQMDECGYSATNQELWMVNYKIISHFTTILFQGARDCIVCAHEDKTSGKVVLDCAFSFNVWGK